MIKKRIKLVATEDVHEFVKAAGKCEFDIDIFYQRIMIDAKSILGVLSIGLSKELTVSYFGENHTFEHVLDKYVVA